MATSDSACSIHPYFEIHEGREAEFKALCERFVAKTSGEEGCLYYAFSFDGRHVHCHDLEGEKVDGEKQKSHDPADLQARCCPGGHHGHQGKNKRGDYRFDGEAYAVGPNSETTAWAGSAPSSV